MYPSVKDLEYTHFPAFQNGGILIPCEFEYLSFTPRRLFQITNVNPGEIRGQHARKICTQLLICTSGKIKSTVIDVYGNIDVKNLTIGDAILIPPFIYDEQIYYTKDSILLVLADRKYDADEYIHSLKEFRKLGEKKYD